jgi:hypothetical protein
MSCCGNKRQALSRKKTAAIRALPPRPLLAGTVRLRFLGKGNFLAGGLHSRQVYSFSSGQTGPLVDALDVPGLLRTGLFELATEP